ncbi:DnaD and phage-associated domain-containing protein [Desulfonispora thiosulfatigenes DSM 11270]|uniref:DnaD and phage-associated domain-containing protein n=1 Tax=Desulfonispora thiosulfatigenes DSM 11270 TaxID=656914 RepID=A0A1W1VRD7_DESTI|nr:DnaD domain protein [Desulfonispora thiosulfatigenes]SMB95484.1 DnaD and phage-associated domain-containing protein [Desulfonispora thiosulfatigenes DSM 11270]
MNYLKELNAFYDWLETNSLSTSSIVLWHALMHINNKAGWTAEFAVAISVLCVKTGLAERTISKARNELKQKGRIDWKQRKGNQAAIYSMISLSAYSAYKHANKDINKDLSAYSADSYTDNHANKCADSYAYNHATLDKLNETKLNETKLLVVDEHATIFKFIEQEFGFLLSPTQLQTVSEWQEIFLDDLIKFAVSEALGRNVRSIGYIDKILLNWQKSGIKTIEQAKLAKAEFEKRNSNVFSKKSHKPNGSGEFSTTNKIRDLDYLVE